MKKFAIYESETGFYYQEYYECPQQLEGNILATIIPEDKYPIVLDGSGGYHQFTEDDFGFVKLIESEHACPLPLEKMFFKNHERFKLGWVSPNGDTYSCSYTGHSKAAKKICEKYHPDSKNCEFTLGRAGWLKVIDSWDGTERTHHRFVYSGSGKITRHQADKLFDLGLYYHDEVQSLIKSCENEW